MDKRIAQTDESRRRFLVAMLGTGLLGTGLLIPGCRQTGVNRLATGRSIYELAGTVTVNGKRADLSTIISPGDTVRTGRKSYIIFIVGTEAFILRSDTTMTISGKNAGGKSAGLAGIRLDTGRMLSVFTPHRPVSIRTPTAVIGIRGTGIYVESEENRSYVCTCYGTTDLGIQGAPDIRESVESTHHSAPRYLIDDGVQARIEPAPFKNHDDEELLLIETLVGRETPFIVPTGLRRSRRRYY